jgi:hypothetical protein
MSLKVEYVDRDSHLEGRITGEFTMRSAVSLFSDLLAYCRVSGASRVIIDYRRITGNLPATAKALYAFKIIDLYRRFLNSGGHQICFAYLGAPPFVSTFEPGNRLAEQHGIVAAVFSDEQEALRWIGVGLEQAERTTESSR